MRTKNNKGYALLWTVVALMLGTIFVAGALQLAGAMSQRSMNTNHRSQAYFTALSVVDTIMGELDGPLDESTPNGKAALGILGKLGQDGSTVRVDSIRGLPSEMGSCRVEITRKGLQLQVTATATHADESYTLTGLMGGTIVTPVKPPPLGIPGLGLGGGIGNVITGGNTGNGSFVSDPDTPIYIWNTKDTTKIESTGSQIMIMGAIYSKGELISLDDNGQKNVHIHGEVVCDGNITFHGDCKIGYFPEGCKGFEPPCTNSNSSSIYTMGELSLSHRCEVAADVTATSLKMIETTSIKGNVKAGSIVMQDGTTIVGDVDAETIIMSGTASINGNVRAKSITMSKNTGITGTVTASEIIMDDDALITGEVRSRSLAMRLSTNVTGTVTAGELIMTSWCKIYGDATVNKALGDTGVRIEGKLAYCETNFDVSKGQADSYEQRTELLVLDDTVITPPTITLPLKSEVPKIDEQPMVTPPEDAPILPSSNKDVTIKASSNGKPRVYVVNEQTSIGELKIEGDTPVLVIVNDGCEFTIEEMSKPPDTNKPILFIQLGAKSELSIGVNGNSDEHPNNFYLFVWGAHGGESKVDIGRRVIVNGGINVDVVGQKKNGQTSNEFHWKAPGDLGWLGDLLAPVEPPEPPEPEDPDNPPEPSEDDEVVWERSGYINQ